MNRRQFLKRISATCAAVVAVPVVLMAGRKKPAVKVPWVRLNTHYKWDKLKISGEQSKNAVIGERAKWIKYMDFSYNYYIENKRRMGLVPVSRNETYVG